MSKHPDRKSLEAFVMGTLPPEEEGLLEAHLRRCDGCAAALAREARLEEALHETARYVAGGTRARPAPARRRALWAALAATPVAAAAAWLLLAGGGAPSVSPVAPSQLAGREALTEMALPLCARGAGQRRCVRLAQRQGLAYRTGSQVVIPRYERAIWPPLLLDPARPPGPAAYTP